MRMYIERAAIAGAMALGLGCGSPRPKVISTTPITEDQLRRALSDGEALPEHPRLEVEAGILDLSRIPIEDHHVGVLDRLDFSAVRELDLSETGISAAAIVGLCGAPGLDQLERLTVDCGADTKEEPASFAESASAIAGCPALRGLKELTIPMCITGDSAARAIASAPWTHLERLILTANDIGPAGAAALAQAKALQGLSQLGLAHNEIGASGFQALADSGLIGRAEVDLANCKLEDASGRALLKMAEVHQLEFSGNPVSEEVANAIAKRFGKAVEVDRY